MLWRDRVLAAKEDFADAMAALQSKEEAEEFVAVFENAFPDETWTLLGYLTGSVHPDHYERVQELLDVEHPLEQTHPALMKLIRQIPRRNWDIRFKKS